MKIPVTKNKFTQIGEPFFSLEPCDFCESTEGTQRVYAKGNIGPDYKDICYYSICLKCAKILNKGD